MSIRAPGSRSVSVTRAPCSRTPPTQASASTRRSRSISRAGRSSAPGSSSLTASGSGGSGRVAESRGVLRAARDTFDALGCAPWGDQARRELRASGESSRRRAPEARDQLTAQELQIAQLAAQGLSNREIGQRLFLSHRTISTHLYRVFPKLGITSRAELGAALAPASGADDVRA